MARVDPIARAMARLQYETARIERALSLPSGGADRRFWAPYETYIGKPLLLKSPLGVNPGLPEELMMDIQIMHAKGMAEIARRQHKRKFNK